MLNLAIYRLPTILVSDVCTTRVSRFEKPYFRDKRLRLFNNFVLFRSVFFGFGKRRLFVEISQLFISQS